jgi:hypothetical protein
MTIWIHFVLIFVLVQVQLLDITKMAANAQEAKGKMQKAQEAMRNFFSETKFFSEMRQKEREQLKQKGGAAASAAADDDPDGIPVSKGGRVKGVKGFNGVNMADIAKELAAKKKKKKKKDGRFKQKKKEESEEL